MMHLLNSKICMDGWIEKLISLRAEIIMEDLSLIYNTGHFFQLAEETEGNPAAGEGSDGNAVEQRPGTM